MRMGPARLVICYEKAPGSPSVAVAAQTSPPGPQTRKISASQGKNCPPRGYFLCSPAPSRRSLGWASATCRALSGPDPKRDHTTGLRVSRFSSCIVPAGTFPEQLPSSRSPPRTDTIPADTEAKYPSLGATSATSASSGARQVTRPQLPATASAPLPAPTERPLGHGVLFGFSPPPPRPPAPGCPSSPRAAPLPPHAKASGPACISCKVPP